MPSPKQPAQTVRDPKVPEGAPGSIKLDTGQDRPKAPTKAEIQWSMLRRLETAGAARSKVVIARNAKHEHQYTVEVAGEDVDECKEKAIEIEHALAVIYPPPVAITTEIKS